jgi:micrococcal nuclease
MRWALPLVVVAAAAVLFALGARDGAAPATDASGRVVRVVDGDTVILGGLGRSRLIGVDTPEVHGVAECYGRKASAYAKRLLAGRRVRYRLGLEQRDRYGRALVYVWLPDGRFFNAMLVRDGYAQPLTIPPNVEFAERFVALARQARRRGRGLWRACARGVGRPRARSSLLARGNADATEPVSARAGVRRGGPGGP